MKSRVKAPVLVILLSMSFFVYLTPVQGVDTFHDVSNPIEPLSSQSISTQNEIGSDALTPSAAISISGDAEFTSTATAEGWTGSGTEVDPYYIDSLNITTSQFIYGIKITDTSVYFVINNTYFSQLVYAIELRSVSNGVVANSTFSQVATGVKMDTVTNTKIEDNSFSNFVTGIDGDNVIFSSFNSNVFTNEDDLSTGIDLNFGQLNNITANQFTSISQNIELFSQTDVRIENNVILDGKQDDLLVSSSSNVSVIGNTFENFGIRITGNSVEHFIHFDIAGNSIQGKSIVYIANATSAILPSEPGQIIIANSSNIAISGYSAIPSLIPVQLTYVDSVTLEQLSLVDQRVYIYNGNDITIADNSIENISSEYAYGSAISISYSNGIIVQDNIISGFYYGVDMDETIDSSILGNTISNSEGPAVSLEQIVNISVKDNTISSNSTGIEVRGQISISGYNNLSSNIITSSDYGIYVFDSIDNYIINNTLQGGTLYFSESNPDFSSYLQEQVTDNTINGDPIKFVLNNNITITGDFGQLIVAHSSEISIDNTTISSTRKGVVIAKSESISFYNLTVENSMTGLEFYDSSSITLRSSSFVGNEIGIQYFRSSSTNIVATEFINNDVAIVISQESSENNIIDSEFLSNRQHIQINPSSDNTRIVNSYLFNSTDYAIQVNPMVEHTVVHYNDFIQNAPALNSQMYDSGTTTLISDNYWSDLIEGASDANHDGVLDSVYHIDGSANNIDNRPRTYPHSASYLSFRPQNVEASVENTSVILEWDKPDGVNSSDIQFYRIYLSQVDDSSYAMVGVAKTGSFEISAMIPGNYTFYITTVTYEGESAFSSGTEVEIVPTSPNNSGNENSELNEFLQNNSLLIGTGALLLTIGGGIMVILRRRRMT